eukprot:TRINITY_DN7056_c0_g1_i2.p1 TRINITY_DN7056_c0_g1~~TRINITY_DN7056_c0_g1_i2.p1  ORF type:complete len:1254 (+),score=243.03 TRINITY_DN7056_c0_g1_i2:124-3885(+)
MLTCLGQPAYMRGAFVPERFMLYSFLLLLVATSDAVPAAAAGGLLGAHGPLMRAEKKATNLHAVPIPPEPPPQGPIFSALGLLSEKSPGFADSPLRRLAAVALDANGEVMLSRSARMGDDLVDQPLNEVRAAATASAASSKLSVPLDERAAAGLIDMSTVPLPEDRPYRRARRLPVLPTPPTMPNTAAMRDGSASLRPAAGRLDVPIHATTSAAEQLQQVVSPLVSPPSAAAVMQRGSREEKATLSAGTPRTLDGSMLPLHSSTGGMQETSRTPAEAWELDGFETVDDDVLAATTATVRQSDGSSKAMAAPAPQDSGTNSSGYLQAKGARPLNITGASNINKAISGVVKDEEKRRSVQEGQDNAKTKQAKAAAADGAEAQRSKLDDEMERREKQVSNATAKAQTAQSSVPASWPQQAGSPQPAMKAAGPSAEASTVPEHNQEVSTSPVSTTLRDEVIVSHAQAKLEEQDQGRHAELHGSRAHGVHRMPSYGWTSAPALGKPPAAISPVQENETTAASQNSTRVEALPGNSSDSRVVPSEMHSGRVNETQATDVIFHSSDEKPAKASESPVALHLHDKLLDTPRRSDAGSTRSKSNASGDLQATLEGAAQGRNHSEGAPDESAGDLEKEIQDTENGASTDPSASQPDAFPAAGVDAEAGSQQRGAASQEKSATLHRPAEGKDTQDSKGSSDAKALSTSPDGLESSERQARTSTKQTQEVPARHDEIPAAAAHQDHRRSWKKKPQSKGAAKHVQAADDEPDAQAAKEKRAQHKKKHHEHEDKPKKKHHAGDEGSGKEKSKQEAKGAATPQGPSPIGPFSSGTPLVPGKLPTIIDSMPSNTLPVPGGLQPLQPTDGRGPADQWPNVKSHDPYDDNHEGMPPTIDGDGTEPMKEEVPPDDLPYEVEDVQPESEATPAEDVQTVITTGQFPKTASPETWRVPPEGDVLRLGEGVGSLAYDRSPTGSRNLNRELRRRLEIQDCATLSLLIGVFAMTVLVSCYGIYQVSEDPSPVAFYSDPRHFQRRLTCPRADLTNFLRAFNGQPQTARLRIIGKRNEGESFGTLVCRGDLPGMWRNLRQRFWACMGRAGMVRGHRRHWDSVLFDVSLDLTPFVTGDGRLRSEDDIIKLTKFLHGDNPLEVVALQKRVEWDSWEDVATNVRQRLRTLGFNGEVDVRFEAHEELLIYRNHPWQNFVRSRITRALVLISVVGGLVWIPYLWARMKKVKVETTFTISLDLQRYWELFSEGLHPIEGFVGARI